MEDGIVYVLQLKECKFYVGWSENIEDRIARHFSGGGAEWTKKYSPEKIIEVRQGGKLLEKLVTIEYMVKNGWENVRGGPWTACALKSAPACMRRSNNRSFITEDQKTDDQKTEEENAERPGST